MPHHTKDKGDIGVSKAHADLVTKGYSILFPVSEHLPFDLVGYKNGYFKRVQVKYRRAVNGRIDVQLRHSWSDKNGVHTVLIDKSEIDVVCVYCPDTDQCYYFAPEEVRQGLVLRVEAPKNNQRQKVKFAADYREVP